MAYQAPRRAKMKLVHKVTGLVYLVTISARVVNGKVLPDLSQLDTEESFDFIVVGGQSGYLTAKLLLRNVQVELEDLFWLTACPKIAPTMFY